MVAAVLAEEKFIYWVCWVICFNTTFWKEHADGEAEGDDGADVEKEEEEHHGWIGVCENCKICVWIPFNFQQNYN